MVQDCCSVLAGWPTTASLYLQFQALLLVEIFEGLDQLPQVPGDDGIEFVQVEIDTVIADAILRKVVRADALAAVAGADQGTPLLCPFAVEFLLLHLVKAAAEDAQGTLIILVLAALVLALDLQPGR